MPGEEAAPPNRAPPQFVPPAQKQSFFDAIDANKRNSWILILFVCGIVVALCLALSYIWKMGFIGFFLGIFISITYCLFAYFLGSSMILAVSGAKPVEKQDDPYLYNLVEGLALAAQIPAPKPYIIEDPAMNAFATGRDPQHSVIVVTRGLRDAMNRQELEGVIAHEMSHIANYDIRFMMLTVVMVGLVGFLSEIIVRTFVFGGGRNDRRGGGSGLVVILRLLLAILAPIIAIMVRFAISRQREFLADASAVQLTRYPDGLRGALTKIKNNYQPVHGATQSTAPMYFADPIGKKVAGLFATHPDIDERIKRLGSF